LDATSTVAGSFVYKPAAGTVLSAGVQTLRVTFTPTDTADYSVATATVSLTVNKAAPAVTLKPSLSTITTSQPLMLTVSVSGVSAPAPTGSVVLTSGTYHSAAATLSNGGTTINVAAGSLAVGSDTIIATYTPDTISAANYATAAQSAAVTVTSIGTATSTVTVTPSATTVTNEQSLTATIAVSGSGGQPSPTGTVTLTSGSYSAQQALSNGTASFNIAAGALANGGDTLIASYSGDATFADASASTAITVSPVTIVTSAPSPVSPGGNSTATATFTAGSNYAGTMNLTCGLTSSPSGAQSLPTCALKPLSITLAAGGSGTTTLTINTTAASTSALLRPSRQNLWGLGAGGAVLAALLFGVPRRRRWLTMMILLAVAAGGCLIGCGGGNGGGGQSTGPTTPATTAGTYVFTVSGTDSTNKAITFSTTVSITVQ
jgi:hypothetical protein